MAGDNDQSIFGLGFSWKSAGINIVGNEFGEKIVEIIESNDENLATLRNKAINFTTFEVQDEGKYKFIKI